MTPYRLYLMLSALAAFAATVAFTLNIVYQVKDVGLNPFQLVLVGTVLEIVIFTAQVPTGVLADQYSRRRMVVIGYLVMGAALVVWGAVPTFGGVLAGNALWAAGFVCVSGAQEAWAASEIGETQVGRAFVRGGQVGQAATVLGILAAVALARISLATPILLGAAVYLALGMFLLAVMTERQWSPTRRAPRTTVGSLRSQAVEGGRAVRRSRVLAYLTIGGIFIGLASEGFDRLSQPRFLDEIGLPATLSPNVWFGAFAVVAAVGSIGVTGWLGRSIERVRPVRLGVIMTIVQAVIVAAMLWFGRTAAFWPAVAAYLVVTLLREGSVPLINVWTVGATEPSSRATVLSIQSQADALGQIAGGPPIGYLARRTSIGAGIAASGLLLVPAVVAFGLAALFSRSAEPAEPAEPLPVLDAVE